VAEFINPYTFVPLPKAINRQAPAGHHRATAGHVSGRMAVTWTLRTALLLPARQLLEPGGQVVIPGSSVKGAVRSLHETLMGGCLRVLDEDFIPVYRQPAVAMGHNWHLAVVMRTTRFGRATHVRVADETVWVAADVVDATLGRVPRTGDTVSIDELAITGNRGLGRLEVNRSDGVRVGRDWVLMVGDSGTRVRSKRFYCAVGRLPVHDGGIREVPGEAWDEYDQLCEGTNDLRQIRQHPDAGEHKGWRVGRIFTDVRWGSGIVGERRRVTGRLWQGDVVWVALNPANGERPARTAHPARLPT
jgi:hypothetical protein